MHEEAEVVDRNTVSVKRRSVGESETSGSLKSQSVGTELPGARSADDPAKQPLLGQTDTPSSPLKRYLALGLVAVIILLLGFSAGRLTQGDARLGLNLGSAREAITPGKQRPRYSNENTTFPAFQLHGMRQRPADLCVQYASEEESKVALSTDMAVQHLRVHIADLPAKYNEDLLEAIFDLGIGARKGVTSKELVQTLMDNPYNFQHYEVADQLFANHPHNLDLLFQSHLSKSPLRVQNASEADIVFVPFWVNKFVKLDQALDKPNRHDSILKDFWAEAPERLPYLGKKPHLLIVPGQEDTLMDGCGGYGVSLLCHELARHLTVLTPEVFVGNGSIVPNAMAPGIIPSGFQYSRHSVAVPDFANIHFDTAIEGYGSVPSREEISKHKTKLVSEAYRAKAPLRRQLQAQCMQRPDKCKHAEPGALRRHNGGEFANMVLHNDQSAWFSLQPPGDTAVRTPLYNSLLAGAIAVVFDEQLYKVLPYNDLLDWESLLFYVPAEHIMQKGENIVDILEAQSEDERLDRLTRLHHVRHLLQFSLKPVLNLLRFDSLAVVTEEDDAFTMAMKAVLRRLCQAGSLPHRCAGSKPKPFQLFGRRLFR